MYDEMTRRKTGKGGLGGRRRGEGPVFAQALAQGVHVLGAGLAAAYALVRPGAGTGAVRDEGGLGAANLVYVNWFFWQHVG